MFFVYCWVFLNFLFCFLFVSFCFVVIVFVLFVLFVVVVVVVVVCVCVLLLLLFVVVLGGLGFCFLLHLLLEGVGFDTQHTMGPPHEGSIRRPTAP